MGKDRLAAFSDGVIAVIITIMVLELKPPEGADLKALLPEAPIFLSYVLSFVSVAIYWNNHHHFFSVVETVSGAVLWANLNLLFRLSLVPFSTNWMGLHPTSALPAACYGAALLMPALSWNLLQMAILRGDGAQAPMLAKALGRDVKGKTSGLLYALGISLAFVQTWIADGLYLSVALIWLIPDRRIERVLAERP